MFVKNLLKAGAVIATCVWFAGSALAVSLPVDGVLSNGDFESYTSGAIAKNTAANVSLTFTAAIGGAELDFSKTSTFGGSFNIFNFVFKDLTSATVLGGSNLLSGPSSFFFGLIAGHLYEIQLNAHTSNAGRPPATGTYLVTVSAVPVPPALLLLGTGLLGAGALGRRRSKAKKISV